MEKHYHNLLENLQKHVPLVLLLGQDYLKNDYEDIFIGKILRKINHPHKDEITYQNYDFFTDNNTYLSKAFTDYDKFLAWITRLSDNLVAPNSLDTLARLPWNSVFISAIDEICYRQFINEWRTGIKRYYNYKETQNIDLPTALLPHFHYLFGSINGIETGDLPPLYENFSGLDRLNARKRDARRVLDIIPNLLQKNKVPGLLIVEGYDSDTDWIELETFISLAESLGQEQTHVFGVKQSLKDNIDIQDLVKKRQICLYEESFAEFVNNAEKEGYLYIETPSSENIDKSVSIGIGREYKVISKEERKLINKYALLVEETLFYSDDIENDDYQAFLLFLSGKGATIHWESYKKNYVFERSIFKTIIEKTKEYLKKNNEESTPLLLHGQASSGKTIALGFLAHQFTQKEQDKYPVIFIHATQKVNEKSKREINHFCKMLEEKYQAKKILIIWDGTNQSYEEYKNFQNELINQGRSVLVVGSAYTSTALRNETRDYLLQIPIELDIQELAHFELYVKRFFPDGNISFNQLFSEFSAKKLNGKGNETNFLILLYRLLPRNRYKIKESLYQEIEVNEQNFEQELETNKVVAKIDDNTFAALFWKQGEEYLRRIGFHPENSYKEIELIEDEAINSKQRLTYYVAVACQFPNIRVPYSVIVRILGFENLSLDLFQRLAQEDFIRIDLDNEYLRTRTSFEAELFISNLLRKTQYQLISELISNIKNDRDEIDFAASLLYFINPQEKDDKKISFQDYWFQTYNMLKEMREIKGIFNARLLIQEVSHLREIIQKDRQEVHGIPLLLANAVENIDEMLREMKDRNEDKKNRSYLYLLTEKVNLLRWEIEYEDDIQTLVDYYEEAKQTVSTVRNINPTNFYALSSFYELVIKHFIKKMDNQDALYWEVIAYLSLMFESAEVEGVVDSFTETHKSQFYEMNAKVAQLTQQSSKMGKAITKLKEKYPEAYYYLQAKEKIASRLAQPDYDKKDIPYFEMAYQVLNQPENQQIVQKDSRCLYLKLRCWWAIKTRKKLFHDSTYQVLPFSSREWREGLILTESLLKIEDGAFSRSHIQYLHALCLFHQDMEMIAKKKAIQEYEELDVLFSVNSYYISRRQDILHIASENGYPKIFTGTVQNNVERGKDQHGEIYLTGIKTRIKFRLADFDHKTIFNRYDEMEFYIGFSFRKPIAVSKEQYEKRKEGRNGKA